MRNTNRMKWPGGFHQPTLSLYRQHAEFEEAGDLLRRLGEEDRAIAEYHLAAERIVNIQKDYVRAGDLMLRKSGRADLAGGYFALGWRERKQTAAAGAMACANRLLEIYAFARPVTALWAHIAEAEEWLFAEGWHSRTAEVAMFFNKLADLGELPHLKDERPAIRDKARTALGRQLRQHAEHERTPGNAVSALFGQGSQWKPEVVSDATFALKAFLKADTRPVKPKRELRHIRLAGSPVVAIAHAPDTGLLFVSFDDGSLIRYDPRDSSTHQILPPNATGDTVFSLSTDATGSQLAGLRLSADHNSKLQCWDNAAECHERTVIDIPFNLRGARLLPITLLDDGLPGLGVSFKASLNWYHLPSLIARGLDQSHPTYFSDQSSLHLRLAVPTQNDVTLLDMDGKTVVWGGASASIGWEPAPITTMKKEFVSLGWQVVNPERVELAGIDHAGVVRWTTLIRMPDGKTVHAQTKSHSTPGGYRGVAVKSQNRLAVVTFTNQVIWMRFAGSHRLEDAAPPVQLNSIYRPVGCFLSPSTDELIVVMGSGEAFHVPLPG